MTKKVSLDYDTALALLERAVAEKGADYAYPRSYCVYFEPDGSPSCIVGHVLAYMGVTRRDVLDWNRSPVLTLCSLEVIEADYLTQRLLVLTQMHQDSGTPWGEAVAKAKGATETVTT